MKPSHILGIILAIALIVFAVAYPVPDKYVYVSSSSKAYDYSWDKNIGAEYLGGDAYNYQVEASLKAGYFSGVVVMKTLCFAAGILLFFLTLYSHAKCAQMEEIALTLSQLNATEEAQKKLLAELAAKDNSAEIAQMLSNLCASREEKEIEE